MNSFKLNQKSEISKIIKTDIHSIVDCKIGGKSSINGYKERNEKTLSVKELKQSIEVLKDKGRHMQFVTKLSGL